MDAAQEIAQARATVAAAEAEAELATRQLARRIGATAIALAGPGSAT